MKVRNAGTEVMSKKEVDRVRIFFCHRAFNQFFKSLALFRFHFSLSKLICCTLTFQTFTLKLAQFFSLLKMTKYEEKIGMKEMFSKHGVPQPELFLSLRPPWSSEQLEAAIRAGVAAVGQVVVTQENSCFMQLSDPSMFVGDVVARQKI